MPYLPQQVFRLSHAGVTQHLWILVLLQHCPVKQSHGERGIAADPLEDRYQLVIAGMVVRQQSQRLVRFRTPLVVFQDPGQSIDRGRVIGMCAGKSKKRFNELAWLAIYLEFFFKLLELCAG